MRNIPAKRDAEGTPLWQKRKKVLIPVEDVIADLHRVTKLLGHPPSCGDMQKHGNVSATTCQRFFGTWENVKRQTGWVPQWELFKPEDINPADGHWLAGIIDGEGCFTMRHPVKQHSAWDPLFTISLRSDDEFMIDEIIRILGITNVHKHMDFQQSKLAKGLTANPAVKLTIYDVHTLLAQLIAPLKIFPLRSKKKTELLVFELAVNVIVAKREAGRLNLQYTTDEIDILSRCYHSLKALKQFKADYATILQDLNLPVH
jgi:hypothetical protein